MSLMLSGVLGSLRGEIRQTANEKQAVLAKAQAQAGMMLALQQLSATVARDTSLPRVWQFEFDGQPIQVRMLALNGLIDLNSAPVELLTALFRYGAGVEQGLAGRMAEELGRMRQPQTSDNSPAFEAPEDLMRVPDFRYEYFVLLSDLVTTDVKIGSGRINPLFAPLGVLRVLTGGDEQLAGEIAARQDDATPMIDTSRLPPAFVEREAPDAFVLVSRVSMPDGGAYQLSWVVHQATDPYSGLPWRVVRSSSKRLPG
ncbi:MAG: hypothetical protein Q8S02_08025 [Hydrogenophaga sp.]|nr:hypothetical protein [Hydrogenophaga sp.]